MSASDAAIQVSPEVGKALHATKMLSWQEAT